MAHHNIPCNGWIVHCIPFVLTLTAFVLSCVAARSCEFLSSQNEVSGLTFWGIFRYHARSDGPCMNINFQNAVFRRSPDGISEDFDLSQPDFSVAQIGAILATSIGFCSASLHFVSFFRPIPARIFKYANACLSLVAMIGCGLSFRLFEIYFCGEGQILDEKSGEYRDIEGACFIESGGTRMAAALVLYLVSSIFLIYMEVPSIAMFEFVRYEALKASDDEEVPLGLTEEEPSLGRTCHAVPQVDGKGDGQGDEVAPELDGKSKQEVGATERDGKRTVQELEEELE